MTIWICATIICWYLKREKTDRISIITKIWSSNYFNPKRDFWSNLVPVTEWMFLYYFLFIFCSVTAFCSVTTVGKASCAFLFAQYIAVVSLLLLNVPLSGLARPTFYIQCHFIHSTCNSLPVYLCLDGMWRWMMPFCSSWLNLQLICCFWLPTSVPLCF